MITISDNTVPQINTAILRLNNNFDSAILELKQKESSDIGRLELKIDEIKRGTLVYTAGTHISISSTGVISASWPTLVSELVNDVGYITSASIPTNVSAFSNDVGYITKAVDDLTYYTPTSGLATVATSGDYNDLLNKPTIPAAQVQSDWTEADPTSMAYIQNKPTLATVATSGSYNDLTDTPTMPTVNDATITIQANGTTVDSFTLNQSTNKTINIPSGPTFTGYTFTYVVDSNQKLSDWANNVSGNDYTSVLIKSGTWSITNKNINLDTTGTKVVVGESGSLLECLNVSSATFNTAHDGFLRSSKTNTDIGTNPDSDRFLFGVNVRVTYLTGTTTIDGAFYGFYGLCNLHSCTGTVVGASSNSYSKACAFGFCFYMYDCKGTVYNARQYNSTYYSCRYLNGCDALVRGTRAWAYESCHNMSKCSGFFSGTLSGATSTVFRTCTDLYGCYAIGTIDSSISTSTMYIFYSCERCVDCIVNVTRSTSGALYGFYTGRDYTGCTATIVTGGSVSGTRAGFNNGMNFVNCVADIQSGSGTAYGFTAVWNAFNCRGRGISTTGSGYAFNSCQGISYCSLVGGSSTTGAYSNCYSSHSGGSTYAAADTVNGGWNSSSVL